MRAGQYVVDPIKCLELKSLGYTIEEIANILSVHHLTVRRRLAKLYRDLGARNSHHAITIAIYRGLIHKHVQPGKVPCEPAAA